jgi:hypothetical protein
MKMLREIPEDSIDLDLPSGVSTGWSFRPVKKCLKPKPQALSFGFNFFFLAQMRSELKLVKATSIYQYQCSIAWIFLQSTDSNVLKVRIDLSLYYLDATLKRYEEKKFWLQNLQTWKSRLSENKRVVMNYNMHADSMKQSRHKISNRICV